MKIRGAQSVPLREWNDWRWQLRNALKSPRDLARAFALDRDERAALAGGRLRLPVQITPYYAALAAVSPAIRRTVIPRPGERWAARGERRDPLGERRHSPAPGVVHTYPDKALLLVTDRCAVYCRYCTRARLAGCGRSPMRGGSWRRALNYLAGAPAVRDVLISGGEPLVLSDERLDGMLRDLRRIRHVEIIRISTKIPAVLPQRITRDLARVLKRHHPLWLSVHFVHPDELTPETARACARLADAGIPMCSQTVLLKGVNDDPATMKRLMTGLLRLRVKPYYLHQCDLAAGASRFRTPVRRGVEILRSLHGHTSGYAAPLFMIDTPGGGGKVPVSPDFVAGRAGGDLLLENYRGETCRYPDFAQEQRRLAGARRSKLCALRLNGATNGIRTRQGHSTAESPTCPDMRQPR